MIEVLTNSIYYLRDLAHPIAHSCILLASVLVYLSGYRLVAVILGIASFSIVLTTIMAWATTNPNPVEQTLPDGSYHMYFEQSIWEHIQYPVYIWATLILAVGFVIFAVQLYKETQKAT